MIDGLVISSTWLMKDGVTIQLSGPGFSRRTARALLLRRGGKKGRPRKVAENA